MTHQVHVENISLGNFLRSWNKMSTPTSRLRLQCPCGTTLQYWYIIDFSSTDVHKIAKHQYVANEEEIALEDLTMPLTLGIWTKKKQQLQYQIRMTHQELEDILTCLVCYSIIQLTDTAFGATNWRVWLADASIVYEGPSNLAYPWNVTLTFIVICECEGFPFWFPLVLA